MQGQLDFEYLRQVAKDFGSMYVKEEFEAFVEYLNSDDLSRLKKAYEIAVVKDDGYRISRWYDRCRNEKWAISPEELEFSRQVGQLLVLFEHLGEKGIEPFSSFDVGYIEEYKKPNWNNLPSEFHYLIDVAESFGIFPTETEMLDFLDRAREEDVEILARTAETIRLNGHIHQLWDWTRRNPFQHHQESWMIYCLLGVMDHAGLLGEWS